MIQQDGQFKSQVGAFAVLNLLDVGLTLILLNSGVYHEGNPLIPTTPGKMLAYKVVVPALFVGAVSAVNTPRFTPTNAMKLLNIGLGAVVAWNALNVILLPQQV